MISEFCGIASVLGLLAGFMAILSSAARRWHFHPEAIRKTLHMGMGCVSLCFPWIFRETWAVFVLAAFAVFWLWSARHILFLQTIFGAVLTEVRRQSWGEMYFALAVSLLFWWSQGQTLLFIIPIGILTFADAFAALVGVRFGKHRIQKLNKTFEGSFAFWATAFCITEIALFAGNFAWHQSLFVAIIVALTTTVAEVFSRDGFDNLSVPLAAFCILKIWI